MPFGVFVFELTLRVGVGGGLGFCFPSDLMMMPLGFSYPADLKGRSGMGPGVKG
jgi:hypothetical protein